MVKYSDKKIIEYLEALSARSPVPGGGSAAALVGSLGASLLGMVMHFTAGKKGSEKHQAEIKKILLASYRLRDRLTRLIDEDIASYLEVSRAQRTAKLLSTQEARDKAMKKALRTALASSLNICKSSHRGLLLSRRVTEMANTYLKSDAKAATFFLFASFHAAFQMCEANIEWLKDDAVAKKTESVLLPLFQQADSLVKEAQKKR